MIYPTFTKINIGLSVADKRNDGFHTIESIFYPLPYGDLLEIIPTQGNGKISLTVYGIRIPGEIATNLCVKAYHILNERYNLPSVKVALLKRVPLGAGLGGGSSDGVEMLKALNHMFGLNLKKKALEEFSLALGSDCPFFVENKPKLVTGRGEIMSKIDLKLQGFWIVLVFPDFHVSTVEAYSMIIPQKPKIDLRKINLTNIEHWKDEITNDFEAPIAKLHPEILAIKEKLSKWGAIYSSMTGSGSTVYGIFAHEPKDLQWKFRWVKIQIP